jgi:hypothetical protein
MEGYTMMRVQMKHGQMPAGPCETFTRGEVQDYRINVQAPVSLAVAVQLDQYPSETYWAIYNDEFVAQSPNYAGMNNAFLITRVSLPPGTYDVVLGDYYGDGIFNGGGISLFCYRTQELLLSATGDFAQVTGSITIDEELSCATNLPAANAARAASALKADAQAEMPNGQLQVFPNPAAAHANVRFAFEQPVDAVVEVADLQGRVLRTLQFAQTQLIDANIEVAGLPQGLYLVKVSGSDGTTAVQKLQVK